MVAYYIYLRKELGSLSIYSIKEWLKLGAAVIVMTIVVLLGSIMLPLMSGSYLTCLVSLAGLVGFAVIVYAVLLLLLKTEIAGTVIEMIKNRKVSEIRAAG
ncbi:hypothetical protein AGMMS49992_00010 [Clostridia bacterium]|nr:hypothetical protein AGMMS49992_00010 [Clostridia bacterium]